MKKQLVLVIAITVLAGLACKISVGTEPPATVVPTATRTPLPTFTPTPQLGLIIPDAATPTPVPVAQQPTDTPTVAPPTDTPPPPPPTDTPTPVPVQKPMVSADAQAVNLRTGPGTNYPKAGTLAQGQSLEIVGRNADASWWQVSASDGLKWVAASVTTASNASPDAIPVVDAPAPPPSPPTAVPPTNTPEPAKPAFQYTIYNVFWKPNKAITQIRGYIKDTADNPVNGVYVRVRAGDFCVVSYPSGPGEPGNYPPGNYDVLIGPGERPGYWQVDIVPDTASAYSDKCRGMGALSETKEIVTEIDKTVVFVEWQKNW